MNLQATRTLANGVKIPLVGLGVYKMTDKDATIQAITTALDLGYRAIDTATIYHNEEVVGEAIRHSTVARDEIFVTTKVWNSDQGYDNTLRAFETSLRKLNMEYVDLYLTHWPVMDTYQETYRAIVRLYEEKLIRVPGVSNHHEHHLKALLNTANVAPMVNQIELHPYLNQTPLRSFCQDNNIAVTAWSPLGRGNVLTNPTIQAVAKQYGVTTAQVVLRWHLQNDVLVIPKSITPSRIQENSALFQFELSNETMTKLDALNRNERFGQDPDNFKFDF